MIGKFTKNFPILENEIIIIYLFFSTLGIEILNIFQLPKFWDVKREIFIFPVYREGKRQNQNLFPTGKLSGSKAHV